MTSLSRVSILVLAGVALAGPLLGAEAERRQLFNGKDLDGWTHVGPGACTSRMA